MKKFAKITAVALVAIMALAVLVACGYPSDPDKAKAQLDKQGYTTVLLKNPTSIGSVTATLTATKNEEKTITVITITYYDDANAAKSAYNSKKSEVDKRKGINKENCIKETISRAGNQIINKTVTNKG